MNSGFIGELTTGRTLSLTLDVGVVNDDAGRCIDSANAWEIPVAADADDARDGVGDAFGTRAKPASSL